MRGQKRREESREKERRGEDPPSADTHSLIG
jgi:hypothetical protein